MTVNARLYSVSVLVLCMFFIVWIFASLSEADVVSGTERFVDVDTGWCG